MKLTKRHALLISALAILMALCTIAGATLAYLFVKTDPVVNTFAPSDIELELEESEDLDLQMIPGVDIAKDPKVSVTTDVDCYVFVKIDKSANYGTYLADYVVATGWTAVPGVDGVYYREVAANATFEDVSVLSGDKVTVLNTVTKTQMEAIATANQPTLTFTAYAIQKAGFADAAAAWPYALAQSNTPNS